jgi:hypothetical protein
MALRETVFWTPPSLAAPNEVDEINSAAAYGFVFDFCGVEIDASLTWPIGSGAPEFSRHK